MTEPRATRSRRKSVPGTQIEPTKSDTTKPKAKTKTSDRLSAPKKISTLEKPAAKAGQEASNKKSANRKRTGDDAALGEGEGPSSSKKNRADGESQLTKHSDSETTQKQFWLLKAEPESRLENGVDVKFSIDDLKACTTPEPWSGVRNHQAKNNMLAMKKGDLAFFYHSNAKPSGIVGIMRVAEEATVDETAFDPKDPYYDPKSSREKPKWFNVHVEFVSKFPEMIDLHTLKSIASQGGALEKMQLVTSSRLSVSKVSKEEWDFIMGLVKK